MTNIRLLLAALSLILLTACQPDLNSNSYDYYSGAMGYGQVKKGVIQAIQYNVKVRKNDNVGNAVGGVSGGILGSRIGGSNKTTNAVGAIGGAVVGGLAGKAVEGAINDAKGTLYVVKQSSGRLFSVIEKSASPLRVGDHVYVIDLGGRPHLVLDKNYYYEYKKAQSTIINK